MLSELLKPRIYIHLRHPQRFKIIPLALILGRWNRFHNTEEPWEDTQWGEDHALGPPMSMLEGGLPTPGEVQTGEPTPWLLGGGALDFISKPLSKEILDHHIITSSIRKAYLNFPSRTESLPEAQNIPAPVEGRSPAGVDSRAGRERTGRAWSCNEKAMSEHNIPSRLTS